MPNAINEFSKITIGELIDQGTIDVAVGFPFGNHNSDDHGVPHIRPFNVRTDGKIDLRLIKSIPIEAALGRSTLRRNDVLFNNTNTKELVGKCALWDCDEEYVFSNHMTRIRVTSDQIDPAYLAFAVLHQWMTGRAEMLARAHVAQASIMGERFREIEIFKHSRKDQESIASLLTIVQSASRSEADQAACTNELKYAATRKLFVEGLDGAATIDSEIGPIPETWSVVELGSLGRVGNGSTPKRTIPEYWKDGYYPWLTSARVYDRLIVEAKERVSDAALEACHLPRLKPGTLLIAITGQGKTLGHCALLGIEATISQHLAYVDLSDGNIDPRFLRGYVETCYKHFRQVASGGGSTKGALTCAFLKKLPIPLPPTISEQQRIADVLDAIDQKAETHEQKRTVLDQLFRILLHKLMTGSVTTDGLTALDFNAKLPTEATA